MTHSLSLEFPVGCNRVSPELSVPLKVSGNCICQYLHTHMRAKDKTNGDLQKMKVSFPTYTIKCVPLYSHSISAVLMSPVHITIIIYCLLGAIMLIILHLTYQKLY